MINLSYFNPYDEFDINKLYIYKIGIIIIATAI